MEDHGQRENRGKNDQRAIAPEPGDPGYGNSPDNNFDRGSNDFDAFPGTEEQMQAAGKNEMSYSHAFSGDPADAGPGAPNVTPGASSAGQNMTGTSRTDISGSNSGGPAGRGFDNRDAARYPGPGTATDRGYGNVGSTPYGTGISETGLGSHSGLDERDLGHQDNAADTNLGANNAETNSSLGTGVPLDEGIGRDSLISGHNQDSGPTQLGQSSDADR